MEANRIAKFFIEGHRSLVEGPDLQTHVRGSTSRRPRFGQSNQSPANTLASVLCGDSDRANPTVGDGCMSGPVSLTRPTAMNPMIHAFSSATKMAESGEARLFAQAS